MKMYTFRVLLLSIALLASTSVVPVSAQETQETVKDSVTLLCKDYSLSNVSVDLSPELSSVSAGETLLVHGVLMSNVDFPITEADVLIKVYKGTHMVDRFVVPLGATIPAGKNHTFSFSWKVPGALVSGDYALTASIISSGKFNFATVALSDNFGKNFTLVKVAGTSAGELFLNNAKAKISGSTIEIPLENSFAKKVDALVKWTLYRVSDIDGTDPLETSVEAVSIPAQGLKTVSYTFKDTSSAEYYAVVEAKYTNATSFVVVPFARIPAVSSTVRFMGLKQNPSGAYEIFGCVSNSFTSPQKSIFITASDKNGEIFTKKFDLGVSSSVGFSGPVALKKTKGSVSISAVVVSAQGAELDKVTTVYNCNTSDLCGGSAEKGLDDVWILYGVTSISLLGLLLLAINKKRINPVIK